MFIFKKNGNANGGRILVEQTIADSKTITLGDAVKLASGKIDLAGAGGAVYGIVSGLRKADGSPLTENGAGGDFNDTYTTGSSNTVVAVVDISKDSLYSVVADDTLGTTTGSDLAGYNFDVVAASDTLDESTAAATTAQFFSQGVDADGEAPSNSVLVTIHESQV